ncbi:hypothetical protein [Chlorogloea sp. CCALA 695]|uniref:hypothetical protein n=1 Tax=Chlorogloea sp. CCALA 695 TaxID=2107693 RepID=UPI000D069FE3|nr:hypothetical protein [Chlorogloea sp. CCALA 695]PSB30638.1 hypothetical protein C7B70_15900 [Chlorogloea sp. CCALA 695]
MKNCRVIFSGLAATVLTLPIMTACQPALTASATTNTLGAVLVQNTTKTNNPCSVHLWDGKNFTDSNIVIKGAGRYSNLRNLPGANNKDWGDEADSLKVGSAATVKVYKEENFKGTFVTYNSNTQQPKISEEPSSLEIVCK